MQPIDRATSDVDYATSIARRVAAQGTGPFSGGAANGMAYADFDQSYDPINGLNHESVGGRYTVLQGDTLQSIAAAVWGDASLWYKIADVNGLTGGESLQAGMSLVIPNKVNNVHNSAETFKPYDPNDILGNLSPTGLSPTPKAAKKNKCGTFGIILMVVIAVAVTAVLRVPMTNLFAFGTTAGVAGATPTLGAAIAGSMVAGAAGSVASQGFAVAAGIQNKFSFKQVALSALSAGISAGVGGGPLIRGAGSFINDAARGALVNAGTQGVAVVTGLQDKFDWAGVVAAGIVGGVTGAVSRALPGQARSLTLLGRRLDMPASHFNDAASSMAGAIAGAASRSLVDGTSFGDNLLSVLPDAIGATIGNALAREATAWAARRRSGPPSPPSAPPPQPGDKVSPPSAEPTGVPICYQNPLPPGTPPPPPAQVLTDPDMIEIVNRKTMPVDFVPTPIQPSDTTNTNHVVRIQIAQMKGADISFLVGHLQLLPRAVLRYIRDRGIKFVATHNNVVEYMPLLHNTQPPGHNNLDACGNPPIWDFRGGTYNQHRQTVVIATDQKWRPTSANWVLHEIGHALNHRMPSPNAPRASETQAFINQYNINIITTPYTGYYDATGNGIGTGHLSETFSETFAELYSGTPLADTPHRLLYQHPSLQQYWNNAPWMPGD